MFWRLFSLAKGREFFKSGYPVLEKRRKKIQTPYNLSSKFPDSLQNFSDPSPKFQSPSFLLKKLTKQNVTCWGYDNFPVRFCGVQVEELFSNCLCCPCFCVCCEACAGQFVLPYSYLILELKNFAHPERTKFYSFLYIKHFT